MTFFSRFFIESNDAKARNLPRARRNGVSCRVIVGEPTQTTETDEELSEDQLTIQTDSS